MINFKQLDRKEWFLLVSSFLMLLIFLIRDQFVPPFIALFVISAIPFFGKPVRKTGIIISISLAAFYLLYVLSLTYTSNWNGVGDILMTKFSLFLFPVVAVFMQRGQQPMLFGIKWGLIIGVAISMLFSFFRLLAVYAMNGELLRASEYALNMHTSYLALLIILATIIFFYERRTLGKFHWFFYPYLLLALFSIINLRSLGAIVCIGVIFTAVPLWYAFKKQKKRWLFIFPAYALGLLLLTYVSPQIKNDLNTSKERTATWMASPEQFLLDNKNDLESNTVRLVAWTLSYRAISEHPLGVGVGDKWDELEFYYRGKGFTFYVYKKLNVHNQFLESGIAIGIPGVLLLLVAFMQALIISWRKNQVIYFLIFLCLLTSNLFESMLERSVGVITLAMMIFVLIQTLKQAEAQNER